MRKIYLFFILFLFSLSIFGLWYIQEFSMDVASSLEINTPQAQSDLLIATQSSEYKDLITEGLIRRLKPMNLNIKVIDISALSSIEPYRWNCIFIAHTWEFGAPPRKLQYFLNETTLKDRIVTLCTSGQGSNKIADVDGISGASTLETVDKDLDLLVKKIKIVLKQNEYSFEN